MRYILAEQLTIIAISLLVLTLVLFLGKSLRFLPLVFRSGAGLTGLGELLFYSLPYFFFFTIPMATMLGALLAFSRMSYDNEITALKGAGVSLYQLIPPVALVAVVAWLVSLFLALFVLPRGNVAFKRVLLRMARSGTQLSLKERVFNNQLKGLVFFVDHLSADGKRLYGVFVSDERDRRMKSTIIAEEGFLVYNEAREEFNFRLFRGNLFRIDKEMKSAQTVQFKQYDLIVDAAASFGKKTLHKKERHLTYAELRQALAASDPRSELHTKLLLEWHRRFSLPLACVVLAFVAVPLGIQSRSSSRLTGLVAGLLLFLLYYMLLSGGKALAENGLLPPVPGIWFPNVLFALLAVVLWVKTARESPLRMITAIRRLVDLLRSRLKMNSRCNLI